MIVYIYVIDRYYFISYVTFLFSLMFSFVKLATLSEMEGNGNDQLENLLQGQRICESEGLFNELRRINCLIGITKGSLDFDAYAEDLLFNSMKSITT